MTKKLFNSMVEATKKGSLFDWLYKNAEELDRDELARIAREIALVADTDSQDPKNDFINEITDFYETFGFDDED